MSEQPFVVTPAGPVDAALEAAGIAAAHWGLPTPVLLRRGMNVIAAAGPDVVLRVSTPTAPAEQGLWLARRLLQAGLRVPAPVRDDVVRHGVFSVIAVERVGRDGPIDWAEVGAMVRRVHEIDPADVLGRYPLPRCGAVPWWQLDALLDEVADLLDDDARRGLEAAAARVRPWPALADDTPQVLCHGDVHPGNVVAGPEGPVLLDWDLLCTGPAAWDHAPLMTWTSRWGGEPGVYEDFAGGYGRSFADDPLAGLLAEARLVAATLLRLRAGRTDPVAAQEAHRRLAHWRGDVDAPTWRAM